MTEHRTIPFSPPDISEEEIQEVVNTLRSGWITTGPKTKQFEQNISDFLGTSKSVVLSSATAAMEMTLRLLGIGPGDEVITSAYTYSASASVITHVGAKVVLVDTAPGSFHIDPAAIERAITPRTKAIIPVDIAGKMCNYPAIMQIVEDRKDQFQPSTPLQRLLGRIAVIADAAHSIGASHQGKKSGQWADFSCFSFHAVKNLTTAEGGAVTWREIAGLDQEAVYHEFMLLCLHGQSKDALSKSTAGGWEYDIVAPNYKCNMTDIMASLGLVQLKRYPEILEKRRHLIDLYDEALQNVPVTPMIHYGSDFKSSGHLYLIRLNGRNETFRNQVIERMALAGIATNVHYKPLPLLTAYKNLGFKISDYPNAYEMYCNEITLPLNTLMTDEDIAYVAENLNRILGELSAD